MPISMCAFKISDLVLELMCCSALLLRPRRLRCRFCVNLYEALNLSVSADLNIESRQFDIDRCLIILLDLIVVSF